MEFILGVLITAAYFVCGFVAYNLGKRSNTSAPQKEANNEMRKQAERIRKGFDAMMAYDVKQALSGKKGDS